MDPVAIPWLDRAFRFTLWADWLALVLGMIPAIYEAGGSSVSLLASALAGGGVLLASATPRRRLTQRFITEGFALSTCLLSIGAVILTGGRDSPFLLLSLIPPIQATLLGGFRVGAATGALAGALLFAAEIGRERPAWVPTFGVAITYLIVVATINQLRRILTDISSRAEESEARSQGTEEKLLALEQAHDLLTRLSEMRLEGTSLPEMGREALAAITDRPEVEGAVAVLERDAGPVVIAQTGTVVAGAVEHSFPLRMGSKVLGSVKLYFGRQIADPDLGNLETALRPLALAFANSVLLEEIAHQAVERERVRVARDLHDEIGPSLASLGLSLDVALMQSQTGPDLAAHMQGLRANVAELIGDIRSTVADLRSHPGGSLVNRLQDVVLGLGPGPAVVIEIEERRPPRPAIIGDLVAIVAEAIRNTYRHAEASYLRIHGWTDFDKGQVVIADNGSGFDVNESRDGHYGLIGMRERADRIPMELSIASGPRGTTILLKWGSD